MLQNCNKLDLQRRTRKEEYNIIHFSNIETIIKQTENILISKAVLFKE
jgi:hypothetical protein